MLNINFLPDTFLLQARPRLNYGWNEITSHHMRSHQIIRFLSALAGVIFSSSLRSCYDVSGSRRALAVSMIWLWMDRLAQAVSQFYRCFNTDAVRVLWSPLAEPVTSVVAVERAFHQCELQGQAEASSNALWITETSRAAEFLRVFLLLQWSGAFVLRHTCRPLPPCSICVFHQWMSLLQFVCEEFREQKWWLGS